MAEGGKPNLVKPINLSDLCTKGTTFEFTPEEHFAGENELVDTFNELDIASDEENVIEVEDKSNISKGGAANTAFQEIEKTMTSIEKNGLVKKRIIKKGYGDNVTVDHEVLVHYNAFWEGNSDPFDSTYMRGYPQKLRPSEGEILPGIEIALLSMKLGEESSFLISHKMLYGERGCPPRIPAMGDALFLIEVINIIPFVRELTPEESKMFAAVLKNATILHSQGVLAFKKGNTNAAVKHFQRAIKLLEKARMDNDEEEHTQQSLLITLNTNLAVAFNKERKPYRARSICHELSKMTDINRNAKILFQFGRALFETNELEKAKEMLMKALRLEPNNTEIGMELSKLDKQIKIERKVDIDFYSKALGFKNDKAQPVEKLSKEFMEEVKSCLNIFIETDNEKEMELTGVYTVDELEYFKKIANELKLDFQKYYFQCQPSYMFKKKH